MRQACMCGVDIALGRGAQQSLGKVSQGMGSCQTAWSGTTIGEHPCVTAHSIFPHLDSARVLVVSQVSQWATATCTVLVQELALADGRLELGERCLRASGDLSGMMLMHSATGNRAGMEVRRQPVLWGADMLLLLCR